MHVQFSVYATKSNNEIQTRMCVVFKVVATSERSSSEPIDNQNAASRLSIYAYAINISVLIFHSFSLFRGGLQGVPK